MGGGSRRRAGGRAVLLAVLVVAVLGASSLAVGGTHQRNQETVDVGLVGVEGYDGELWPYTSRAREFGTATLPVNLVVETDAETVALVLVADESDRWTVEHGGEQRLVVGSGAAWASTTGATRYTYVETAEGGRWVTETRQLDHGPYFGARYHVRLYQVGEDGSAWTAVQAHREHWDWFRLRHTVGSVADARYAVEHEFYGTGLVADVRRVRVGNGGALDADGWVTVVEPVDGLLLLPLGLFVVLGSRDGHRRALGAVVDRVDGRHLRLSVVLLATPAAVRAAAVTADATYPDVSPGLVAASGYLALAAGLPLAAAWFGRRLCPADGFAVAVGGLGAGFLLDYALLGVVRLPLSVVGHRVVLLVGVGLLAAGGWDRSRRSTLGAGIWIVAIVWALTAG